MNYESRSVLLDQRRCPRCQHVGRDRKGDNLSVYSDGHTYCFGCGYYSPSPATIANLKKKINKNETSEILNKTYYIDPETINYDVPNVARKWLDKYGITDSERHKHGIYYWNTKDYLVFPVLDGDKLVGYSARYFGSNPKHPKYITKGLKHQFFKLITGPVSECLVLTEDILSAIKAARITDSLPIFGSFVPEGFALRFLLKYPRVRLWLDYNKATESIKQCNKFSQWHKDIKPIITELDPKDYTTSEIKEYIDGSLSKSIEVVSTD